MLKKDSKELESLSEYKTEVLKVVEDLKFSFVSKLVAQERQIAEVYSDQLEKLKVTFEQKFEEKLKK